MMRRAWTTRANQHSFASWQATGYSSTRKRFDPSSPQIARECFTPAMQRNPEPCRNVPQTLRNAYSTLKFHLRCASTGNRGGTTPYTGRNEGSTHRWRRRTDADEPRATLRVGCRFPARLPPSHRAVHGTAPVHGLRIGARSRRARQWKRGRRARPRFPAHHRHRRILQRGGGRPRPKQPVRTNIHAADVRRLLVLPRRPRLPARSGHGLFRVGGGVQFRIPVLRRRGRFAALRRADAWRAGIPRRAHRVVRDAQQRPRRGQLTVGGIERRGRVHVGQQDHRFGRRREARHASVRGHPRHVRRRVAQQLQLPGRRLRRCRPPRVQSGRGRGRESSALLRERSGHRPRSHAHSHHRAQPRRGHREPAGRRPRRPGRRRVGAGALVRHLRLHVRRPVRHAR